MSGTDSRLNYVCATGGQYFLKRYSLMVSALKEFADRVEPIAVPEIPTSISRRETLSRLLAGFPLWRYRRTPQGIDRTKTHWAFDYKSRNLRREILKKRPDLVFHLFCQSRPPGGNDSPPFTLSLDYTMALAARDYPAWAEFPDQRSRDAWMRRERQAYRDALCIFPWSAHVKDSLVEQYDISPDKIVVTGSSGLFTEPYSGSKTFGSYRLFMNASDFARKGGDIAVEALPLIRRVHPTATLSIVGVPNGPTAEGVHYVGHVDGVQRMQELFVAADLVLAPARCEPYGSFLVEALNYGTPCVVSDRGGMKEIVDHDQNGWVLEKNTPEALASAVNALLSDRARLQRYSDHGRAKVSRELNWRAIARKVGQAVAERRPSLFPASLVRT
jgi:glycogen synthase